MRITRRVFLKTIGSLIPLALYPEILKGEKRYLKIPVLMYHEIREHRDDYSISPSQFASQMEYLYQNGYKTLFFKEVEDILKRRSFNKRYMIITFDDGSLTFMEYAYPLLMEYGFKATMNIIGKKTVEDRSVMSLDECRELIRSNIIEIGCHTFDLHGYNTPLTELTDTIIKEDIRHFRDYIDRELGIRTDVFSLPFGIYNRKTVEIIRDLGFSYILTSDEGFLEDIKRPVPRLNINWRLDLTSFIKYIGGKI